LFLSGGGKRFSPVLALERSDEEETLNRRKE
jgi:hypothetical protein